MFTEVAYTMPTQSRSTSTAAAILGSRRIRLTKSTVANLPTVDSGQRLYWDADLPGFGLRVCKTTKTYVAEGKLRGRTRRVKLGSAKVISPDSARQEARKILLAISLGKDPRFRRSPAGTPSLDDAFSAYLTSRSLKPSTLHDYDRIRRNDFRRWLKLPITEISKDMVEALHRDLGRRSHARANNAMRVLRAVLNYSSVKYELDDGTPLLVNNPVQRLTKTKAWFRIERRKTLIRAHELGPWLRAVAALPGRSRAATGTIRDYLLCLMMTGLRRSEGAMLRWQDVDLTAKTITVRDTKNGDDHTLPLSSFLFALLQRRHDQRDDNVYVFPSTSLGKHIVEPRKQMAQVTKSTGIAFTLHDLRRTFITVAESLDIPAYALKRLLNHKMRQDVTAGYIIPDPERLREPMEKISGYMLAKAEMPSDGSCGPTSLLKRTTRGTTSTFERQ